MHVWSRQIVPAQLVSNTSFPSTHQISESGPTLTVSWGCLFSACYLLTFVCNLLVLHVSHHHHMALQPKSGPGLPLWGFLTITFLRGWIVSPEPNPHPGGPGLRVYGPRRQGGPAIPQALGTHFSRLLRHAVGLFFNPGHHAGQFLHISRISLIPFLYS
jgi:hypothetical protein